MYITPFFIIGKLHMHPMDLQAKTSPSTHNVKGEEVPVELELIGENV